MATPEYNDTTDELFAKSSEAMTQAINAAYRIGGIAPPNLLETRFDHDVQDIVIDAPPKFSDLFEGGNNTDAIIANLNDQVDEWLAKYFPSINGAFKNIPDDYLIGVISGVQPFGIPSTIFDLVWHKARDRAYRTTESEQRTLAASMSMRGFTLPSGAMVDLMAESERRATSAILDVNRDEAIKDAEIKKDILQHAVGIASQLKQGILNTSAQFFKAYYDVYGLDNEIARIRAQAYNSFYNALSAYYGVEIAWEDMRMRSESLGTETDNNIDRNRLAMYSESGVANAHAQATNAFAQVAASSASAAGSLVAEIENL